MGMPKNRENTREKNRENRSPYRGRNSGFLCRKMV